MRIFFPDVNVMIYLIIVAVIVLVVMYRYTSHKTFHRNFMPKSVCEHIIETSKNFKFLKIPEVVDGKPMEEISIYDEGAPVNQELWNLCEKYYIPLASKYGLQLNYAFLRRYEPGDRDDLIMHFDDIVDAPTTINILLSDPRDFEGGDLYIFNKNNTNKILKQHGGDMNIKQRKQFIKECSNMPVLNLRQGDAVFYKGCELLHGVMPVTSGKRYVLGFFSTQTSTKLPSFY